MVTITSSNLEEFLTLPETQPASEFVNAYIYQKPMPQGKHSRLQFKLCITVNQVAEPDKIALAFPGLRCTFGERSIVLMSLYLLGSVSLLMRMGKSPTLSTCIQIG